MKYWDQLTVSEHGKSQQSVVGNLSPSWISRRLL